MAKIITIDKCAACPNHSHRCLDGHPYVPYCAMSARAIPYEVNGRIAKATVSIPDWCPLEDHAVTIPATHGLRADVTDIAL